MKSPDSADDCSRGWEPGHAGATCLCYAFVQGFWTNYLFVVSFTAPPLTPRESSNNNILTSTQKIKSIKEEG